MAENMAFFFIEQEAIDLFSTKSIQFGNL